MRIAERAEKLVEVQGVILPAINMTAVSGGLARSTKIECPDANSRRQEWGHNIRITGGMFSNSVDDGFHGLRRFRWHPGLGIQREPAGPFKNARRMFPCRLVEPVKRQSALSRIGSSIICRPTVKLIDRPGR